MEYLSHSDQLCYVRCNFCNIILAVEVPCRRSVETVNVKCGYCNSLSFLSIRPLVQPSPTSYLDLQKSAFQVYSRKDQSSGSSSSTSSQAISSNNAPYVVKPPERKHRLPSAYNRFMKEEIKRIKAANPDIAHRDAFSSAAKNWARYIPHPSNGPMTDQRSNNE